jgi:hypothetical protein
LNTSGEPAPDRRKVHMMRLRLILLVLVCSCNPAVARAGDGGWIEWLEKWSGPKLVGIGSQIHLLCYDAQNSPVSCERWYGLVREPVAFDTIRHEVDFRFGYYWMYGSRFSDVEDTRSVKTWRLMGMYHYHAHRWLEVGAGAGFMPVFGEGFDSFTRGLLTPVSLKIAPFGGGVARGITLQSETSYIFAGFTGADLGNTATQYSTGGEWNVSFAVGYDFRRR